MGDECKCGLGGGGEGGGSGSRCIGLCVANINDDHCFVKSSIHDYHNSRILNSAMTLCFCNICRGNFVMSVPFLWGLSKGEWKGGKEGEK